LKRITFVEPCAPDYHIYSNVTLPRLGPPLLATILKNYGYETKVFCEDIEEIDYDYLFQSDIVAISIITSTAPRGYEIAKMVSKRNIPTIIGGIHATFLPEEALRHATYCIRREGEETIVELLEHIEGKRDIKNILGLSYKTDTGVIHHNPDRPPISDLSKLPLIDLSTIQGHKKINYIPIETSRGCPFNCNFCSVAPMFGRKFRYKDPEVVVEEILKNKDGRRHLFFYDDNFTSNKDRTKALLELILKKKLNITWMAQTRIDVVEDKELLELMKQSKCSKLFIGFESVNPKTLESYNKSQGLDQIKRCISILQKYKIKIHGMFVLGSDEDDRNTIKETFKFAKKFKLDTAQFAILTPIPGSRLYEKMKEAKRIFLQNWNYFDGQHVVFDPLKISAHELQKEIIDGMKNFYSLWQSIKLFFRKGLIEAIFRFFGGKIVKKWKKKNKEYLNLLKAYSYVKSKIKDLTFNT
jgi:radical SAM superfamily enzyme YgiQ (UPF0313 family)